MLPSGFNTGTMGFNQSVGPLHSAIISSDCKRFSSSFNLSLKAKDTDLGEHVLGSASGFNTILCTAFNLPRPWKTSWNSLIILHSPASTAWLSLLTVSMSVSKPSCLIEGSPSSVQAVSPPPPPSPTHGMVSLVLHHCMRL